MAESTTVSLLDIELFKQNALVWANQFPLVCLLDSNNYPHKNYSDKDWVLAVDAVHELEINQTVNGVSSFDQLKEFQSKSDSTIFGFLSYELKNEIEKLSSNNFDGLKFPYLYFFQPRYVLEIKENRITVNRNYPETFHLLELIQNIKQDTKPDTPELKLQSRTSHKKYLENVNAIRKQIGDGDFYELNYCCEFYAAGAGIDPTEVFSKLNLTAQAPFSTFFKLRDKYLICASPERFLKKEATKIISQPIKGTARRGNSAVENKQLKSDLKNNPKERAENVMIVDLVRNDLARSSIAGSVKVEELFGIYEFNTVIQMISTVTSEIEADIHAVDVIKNAFPMGSMTGAPKIEVMKNIDRYEDFKRGLFSGAVGYLTPTGNFDFNVVIRSILYNATEKYLSVRTGSAITYDSDAEKEWSEILLKAQNLLSAINGQIV